MNRHKRILIIFLSLLMVFCFCFSAVGCNSNSEKPSGDITKPSDPDNTVDPENPDEPDNPDDPDEPDNPDKPGERKLTFEDNFDGDTLDESKWEYLIGTGANYGLDKWGNGEAQYYKKANASVSDGELKITMLKEKTLSENGKEVMNYTSSRLRTKGKFSQTYGRFEARIKVDAVSGLWPAFWMMPEDSVYGDWPRSGEIDIMELRGRESYFTTSALHFTTKSGGHDYKTKKGGFADCGSIDEYHIYAVEWTSKKITFLVDNVEFYSLDTWLTVGKPFPAPYNQDFHIILNLAAGGHFDGYRLPPDRLLPAEMTVDYVRAYAPL